MITKSDNTCNGQLDRLREILEKCQTKKQQLYAAQCGTDRRAVELTQREYDDAIADWHAFVNDAATWLIYTLEIAMKLNPESLRDSLLRPIAASIAEAIQEAVAHG